MLRLIVSFLLLYVFHVNALPVQLESFGADLEHEKLGSKPGDGSEDDPLWPLYDVNEKALKVLNAKEQRVEDGEDEALDYDLGPAEHLEGVKISRHGKINEKYDEELFLGSKEMEKFEEGDMTDREKEAELRKIVDLIDTNHNGYLEEQELETWVFTKTQDYFEHAKQESLERFHTLDSDENGLLDWEEYLIEYIAQKGLDWEKLAHKLTLKEAIEALLPEDLREDFDGIKDNWIEIVHQGEYDDEADVMEEDDEMPKGIDLPLSYEMFLEFLHPETSEMSLRWLVEDFIQELDEDGDNMLSLAEYRGVETETRINELNNEDFLSDRENEFTTMIDANGDGMATADEIKNFLNPLSESNAHIEARQLIDYGDDDGDGRLSAQEVVDNSEFFIDTKLYSYARAVHYDL